MTNLKKGCFGTQAINLFEANGIVEFLLSYISNELTSGSWEIIQELLSTLPSSCLSSSISRSVHIPPYWYRIKYLQISICV